MIEGITYPVLLSAQTSAVRAPNGGVAVDGTKKSDSTRPISYEAASTDPGASLVKGFTVAIQEYQEAFMDDKRFPPSLFQMMRDKIEAMSKPEVKHSFEA